MKPAQTVGTRLLPDGDLIGGQQRISEHVGHNASATKRKVAFAGIAAQLVWALRILRVQVGLLSSFRAVLDFGFSPKAGGIDLSGLYVYA